MILDKLSLFSDSVALTNDAVSSVIDHIKDGDFDLGRKMNIFAQLEGESPTPANATVQVSLQRCADGDDPTVSSNWKTVETYEAVKVSDAIKGKRLVNFAKRPLGGLRYERLSYAVLVPGSGSTMIKGSLTGAKVLAGYTPSCEIDA